MKSLLKIMLILTAGLFNLSCQSEVEYVEALQCYLIKSNDTADSRSEFDYGRAAYPIIEMYMKSNNFDIPQRESSAGSFRFKEQSSGTIVTFVLGIDDAAGISLYDLHGPCEHCSKFDSHMHNVVASSFSVINCKDIEDYETPRMYNPSM